MIEHFGFWWGLLAAVVLAYPLHRLVLGLNARQNVSDYAPETHRAKQGTPTMGGLMFVLPLVLVATQAPYYCYPVASCDVVKDALQAGLPGVALILLITGFALIGFIDDFVVPRLWVGKRGLGWIPKLGLQLVCALVYSLAAGHDLVQVEIDVFVILAASNAFNFADGLDGLASSIGLLLIPGLVALNAAADRPAVGQVLLMAAGAMIPFAFLNSPKAKIFMGDVGSLAMGALIGAAFALPAPALANWRCTTAGGLLSLVLLAELVPVPLQILWVKVFKQRLFPFTPVHHAFEKAGWPETRVTASFALAQLVCTVACINVLGGLGIVAGPRSDFKPLGLSRLGGHPGIDVLATAGERR